MELVELLIQDVARLKAQGMSPDEITAHVDSEIAAHNERVLARLRMQDMVAEAQS